MLLIYGKPGWRSPRELARIMGAGYVRTPERPNPRRRYTVMINWGNTEINGWAGRVLNPPHAVRVASNKLLTFRELSRAEVRTVPWTEQKADAVKWHNDGKTVYGRRHLSGKAGHGIDLVRPTDPVTAIKRLSLYTRYVKPDAEVRVHVVGGRVVDYVHKKKLSQESLRERGVVAPAERNFVRSHDNGWVFARNGVERHEDACACAIAAVGAVGLDFGAVDILIRGGRAYVLEVNSAPGLEGTTFTQYANGFRDFFAREGA